MCNQKIERWVIFWLGHGPFLVELIVISIEVQHTFFGRQLATPVQQEIWLMAPSPGNEKVPDNHLEIHVRSKCSRVDRCRCKACPCHHRRRMM